MTPDRTTDQAPTAKPDVVTPSIVGTPMMRRVADTRAALYQEDLARERRTYGTVRPPEAQVGTRTWKSYSKIRAPSQAFREGWDRIDWTDSTCR